MKTIITKIIVSFAVLVAIVTAAIALHPQWRMSMRDRFQPEFRKLLSTTYGNVLGDGSVVQIIKVKTRDALFLEIYKPTPTGHRDLLTKIQLEQNKDGFFILHGQATNLAINDIDGDSVGEIIAPAFDQNLTAHLNVYRYDKSTQSFYRVRGELEFPPISNL